MRQHYSEHLRIDQTRFAFNEFPLDEVLQETASNVSCFKVIFVRGPDFLG